MKILVQPMYGIAVTVKTHDGDFNLGGVDQPSLMYIEFTSDILIVLQQVKEDVIDVETKVKKNVVDEVHHVG